MIDVVGVAGRADVERADEAQTKELRARARVIRAQFLLMARMLLVVQTVGALGVYSGKSVR